MKYGISIKIDVTKIEKERIYVGEKGKYLTITSFVDVDNQDEYGNNGMVTHEKKQGEDRAPILGNAKVFWKSQETHAEPAQAGGEADHDSANGTEPDDIPF